MSSDEFCVYTRKERREGKGETRGGKGIVENSSNEEI